MPRATLLNPPNPNPEEVERFRALYLKKYVALSDEEAYDLCSRLVRFVWTTECVVPVVRRNEQEAPEVSRTRFGIVSPEARSAFRMSSSLFHQTGRPHLLFQVWASSLC